MSFEILFTLALICLLAGVYCIGRGDGLRQARRLVGYPNLRVRRSNPDAQAVVCDGTIVNLKSPDGQIVAYIVPHAAWQTMWDEVERLKAMAGETKAKP